MSGAPSLHWLQERSDWRSAALAFKVDANPTLAAATALAVARLDFVRTNMLDAIVQAAFRQKRPADLATTPIRLAILGSSTLTHLHAAIRIAGLRRGLWIDTYEGPYGQLKQELLDPSSGLHRFEPTSVLFAYDAWHVTAGLDATFDAEQTSARLEHVRDDIQECWRLARDVFGCKIMQQTVLPTLKPMIGSNEHRLPGSRAGFITRLNHDLRDMSSATGVDLVALDDQCARHGLAAWHDIALWYRSKQDISPMAAPMYGELVGRILAAGQGRSSKCLVLDLDNTLWGGVVGDDGLEGLILGQGSAVGEAFVALQDYVLQLSKRGVILAVCSKNDMANAVEAFEKHPDMILKLSDIADFTANWTDKATNIRNIAGRLNIGLDSLVFLDDNPVERNLVRAELPMVGVPELSDDPAQYPAALADAGYFESVAITREDRDRADQYRSNAQRDVDKLAATDMESFLKSLQMELTWNHFDHINLPRITQLINKTNQFNLTTRRYNDDDVLRFMNDDKCLTLQLRLVDKYGDNGIISIIAAKLDGVDLWIDTWLMSCRVLGRHVERASLNIVADLAIAMGARRLIGEYIESSKNAMVSDHYARLGFHPLSNDSAAARWLLDLDQHHATDVFMRITKGKTND